MDNTKKKSQSSTGKLANLKKSDKFILAMAFLNPILYYISPILFIISIVLEIIFIFKEKDEFYKKFWKAFLLSISFFGVSIFHVKVYYWVFIMSLPYVVLKINYKFTKREVILLATIVTFAIYLTLMLLVGKIDGSTISEYSRYIMCFIILYMTIKTLKNIDYVKEIMFSFKLIAIVTIISGFTIEILRNLSFINFTCHIHTTLYNVDISSASNFRTAAFFSDPNLYFAFFISLLAIYEFIMFYCDKENNKIFDSTNIFLIIASLTSLSRTAIMAIVVYIIAKFITMKVLNGKRRANTIFWSSLVMFIILIGVIFNSQILELFNWVLHNLTILIGRTNALDYSSNFTSSSRVISWGVALDSIKGHWLLGRGFNYWNIIYYMPPHNSFIMMAQDAGLLGLIFLIGIIIYGFKNIPLHIIIFLLLMPMLTLDLQNFLMLFVIIGIGVILSDSKEVKIRK